MTYYVHIKITVDVGFTQTGITLRATKQVQNIKIEVGVLHGVLNNTDIVTLNCSTEDGTAKGMCMLIQKIALAASQ